MEKKMGKLKNNLIMENYNLLEKIQMAKDGMEKYIIKREQKDMK